MQQVSHAINFKFLLLTLGIVATTAIAIYFVHKWQVDRNANVFREQAEAARKKGESDQAIAHYARYLGFRPDDTDARAALGMLIDDSAKSATSLIEAYLSYEKVLLEQDDRDEIRQRLIDVAIKLGRYSDAESHIQRLLPSATNSAELEYKLGLCAEFQNQPEPAVELYQKAIKQGYRAPKVFLQLVSLLNRKQDDSAQQAENLIDQMIEANPESVEAILVRAKFRLSNGQPEEAHKDLARVEELDPGNIESVLLGSGIPAPVGAPSNEALDASRSQLKLAIERKPADSRLYQRLAQLDLSAGDQEAALQVLFSGIAAVELPGELLATLGDLLISQGKLPEAEEQLQRLRQLDGAEVFVDYLDARLLTAKGNFPAALKSFRKVQPQVAEIPELRELCSLYLASCFEAIGEPDEQIAELRNALSINPQAEQTALRLASALQANGKRDEALGHYRQLSHLPGVPLEAFGLRPGAGERVMSTVCECRSCGQQYRVGPQRAGTTIITCHECGANIRVPRGTGRSKSGEPAAPMDLHLFLVPAIAAFVCLSVAHRRISRRKADVLPACGDGGSVRQCHGSEFSFVR